MATGDPHQFDVFFRGKRIYSIAETGTFPLTEEILKIIETEMKENPVN